MIYAKPTCEHRHPDQSTARDDYTGVCSLCGKWPPILGLFPLKKSEKLLFNKREEKNKEVIEIYSI